MIGEDYYTLPTRRAMMHLAKGTIPLPLALFYPMRAKNNFQWLWLKSAM